MSEFHVEVVRIGEITKHPNADKLSITVVHSDYPCIVKTGDFKTGDLAVYIPVDALVPLDRPEFQFLDDGKSKKYAKIKARRLRGIFSMGLLIPAPAGVVEGQDMQEALGIKKWLSDIEQEAEESEGITEVLIFPGVHSPSLRRQMMRFLKKQHQTPLTFAEVVFAIVLCAGLAPCLPVWGYTIANLVQFYHNQAYLSDSLWFFTAGVTLNLVSLVALGIHAIKWHRRVNTPPDISHYDIEGLRKYSGVFQPGEEVSISEKIHGTSSSFVSTKGKFWVKSRNVFKSPPSKRRHTKDNVWWDTALKYDLARKLKSHPDMVLFGEVYGKVQDLRYGVPAEEVIRFAAFDVFDLRTRAFLDVDAFLAFCKEIDVPTVPELYRGPWDPEKAKTLAEGKTTLPGASHVREGIVVKPLVERHAKLGRVILKFHGEGFLTRKEG